MDKIKVLVVDDHALMRDGIRALLGSQDDIDMVGEASGEKRLARKHRSWLPTSSACHSNARHGWTGSH